jgi:hypothetical protein
VVPAGTLPDSTGVLSEVLLSLGVLPLALSLTGSRPPVAATGATGFCTTGSVVTAAVHTLFTSEPSALRLPAASATALLSTRTLTTLAPWAGVKVAV